MAESATTIDQQLTLLKSRGLTFKDINKASEILQDIGYYRLGFYLFPLEKTYPKLKNRTHKYVEGASFEDAVNLYYFDFDLRLLLMRYLSRIEIAFRTSLIYNLSNKYKSDPTWFASPLIVNCNYIQDFKNKVYTTEFKRIPVIRRHHLKNPGESFAPAWKTLEFLTFGAILKLYEQLIGTDNKIFIAKKFGVRQVVTFHNYMHTIRHIRNACAHSLVLYDFKLPLAIRRGPASYNPSERNNILGALRVVKYIMSQISENRAFDLSKQIKKLYDDLCLVSPNLKALIPDFSDI